MLRVLGVHASRPDGGVGSRNRSEGDQATVTVTKQIYATCLSENRRRRYRRRHRHGPPLPVTRATRNLRSTMFSLSVLTSNRNINIP